MKRDGWLIPLGALLFVTLAALCCRFKLESQDLAAWVQAIGSIGAIGAAVWVLHRQHEQDKETERQEVRAFVASVREELATMWAMYEIDMRPLLNAVKPGEYLDVVFPGSQDVFTIYNNASAQVGRVPDEELRQLIVIVYALAKSLISAFQLNNVLVQRHQSISTGPNSLPENLGAALAARRTAAAYVEKMKQVDGMLFKNVDALITAADKWLAS
ncbi:hypothetical protein [Caballeronia grimmiae]|uniref:hypothetical protein n=1 Tax=Caballeronia grimmiae TaxID=1071679 RepID=UPI0038BD9F18